MWELTHNEVTKYDDIFVRLNPTAGKLDGEKVKPVMMNSQLSVETLGKIWDLADIDADGYLDRGEFLLAMHLIHRCVEGDMLPDKTPDHILYSKARYFARYPPTFTVDSSPPAKDPFAHIIPSNMAIVPLTSSAESKTQPLALTYMPSTQVTSWPSTYPYSHVPTTSVPTPVSYQQHSPMASSTYPPWAISSEEFAKASVLFASIDLDADGLVSGLEARDILLSSHVQQNILAHIWDLVDFQGIGMLNCEQFAVALHLASEQRQPGPYPCPLPDQLPPALVPPSLRPIPPDPAMFAESNKLIAQIESIKKECSDLEASHAQLNAVSQIQAAESAENIRLAEAHEKAARSLIEQNAEAGRRLGEYAAQRDALRDQLEELKKRVNTERQHVDEVRSQIDSQQAVTRNQESELTRLRNDLNELIREEAQLHDKLSDSRRRLEVIEAENRETQRRVEQTNRQVAVLESTRSQLMEVLVEYQSMLSGDASVTEPNEVHVTRLLSSDGGSLSLNGSFTSFDTGLGSGSWASPQQQITPFPDPLANLEWLSLTSRTANNGTADPAVVGAIGGNAAGQPLLVCSANSNGLADTTTVTPAVSGKDPFTLSSQQFSFDPFKDSDPFGGDPFECPTVKSNSVNISAFDPFAVTVTKGSSAACDPANVLATNPVLTGPDFDAVFGPPTDLFSSDPFSAVEQFAEQQSMVPSHVDSQCSTVPKKFPPPRPKSQPGEGKISSGRKSTGDQPNHYLANQTAGSLTTGLGNRPSPRSHRPQQQPGSSHNRALSLFYRGRSKRDSGSHSHSAAKSQLSRSSFSSDMSGTAARLTEEQQLSLATLESARLAQEEARARQQEEADLQLAIQLSKLDASSS